MHLHRGNITHRVAGYAHREPAQSYRVQQQPEPEPQASPRRPAGRHDPAVEGVADDPQAVILPSELDRVCRILSLNRSQPWYRRPRSRVTLPIHCIGRRALQSRTLRPARAPLIEVLTTSATDCLSRKAARTGRLLRPRDDA